MSKNNISILFWLYKSKTNKQGFAPLYLRISHQSQRKNIATGFRVNASMWDPSKGSIKGNSEVAQQINTYIMDSKSTIIELFNAMLKKGDVSLDILINHFLARDADEMTLLQLVEHHNQNLKSRIGIDYAFSTYEKYDILDRKLKSFLLQKYKKKDVRLKEIPATLMSDFDFHLKEADKNSHNTATKYLKNLKKILNHGIRCGWLDKNPFEHFGTAYKDVNRVYLTIQELLLLQAKKFAQERLTLVRDLFLFQCYTGLAYSDMAKLTQGDITVGIDGAKWIIIRRKKTGVRAAIPLLSQGEAIIDKYNKVQAAQHSPLFNFYSIQRFNSYLHEIAVLCNINKVISSHVGRRTFATTIALGNGMGLETISKILGHTNIKITAQYAVVNDYKISQEMKDVQKRLDQKGKK